MPHLFVRRVVWTAGEVEVEVSYEPRPEYGLVVPLLDDVPGGVTARGGAEWLVLSTPARSGQANSCSAVDASRSRRPGTTVNARTAPTTSSTAPIW